VNLEGALRSPEGFLRSPENII
ncbi:hypothetical protein LCGC14_2644070, partial [marine sediment metagenome]